jgi:hypothetical protein
MREWQAQRAPRRQVVGHHRLNPSVLFVLDAPPSGATIERRHNLPVGAIEIERPLQQVDFSGAH